MLLLLGCRLEWGGRLVELGALGGHGNGLYGQAGQGLLGLVLGLPWGRAKALHGVALLSGRGHLLDGGLAPHNTCS